MLDYVKLNRKNQVWYYVLCLIAPISKNDTARFKYGVLSKLLMSPGFKNQAMSLLSEG
jgi:hypothetical protein